MATFWEKAAHSIDQMLSLYFDYFNISYFQFWFLGKRGGLVVEPRTPEREVGGSIPISAVLCP